MGPLHGLRVIEFAGIGPGPFACMMLADMGAEVIRIERPATSNTGASPHADTVLRGRRSITLDLKDPQATGTALKLIEGADALVEGFRPGVMERLGLGPDVCFARNRRLVYGRMTGWGQDGPLAPVAGHDINYISLSGALWAIGEAERDPVPPLNLLGDYGGGGMFLAFGIVCALLRAQRTGEGDVVDAAICDGTAALAGPLYSALERGLWSNRRAGNRLDGAAPFYGVYKCSDGLWVTIAPLEDKFWDLFLKLMELDPAEFADRTNPAVWPGMRARFERLFARQPRAHWCALFEGTDICFAPVLSPAEAAGHAHNRARGTFVERDGVLQPAPAPRFQNAPADLPSPPPVPGADTRSILRELEKSEETEDLPGR